MSSFVAHSKAREAAKRQHSRATNLRRHRQSHVCGVDTSAGCRNAAPRAPVARCPTLVECAKGKRALSSCAANRPRHLACRWRGRHAGRPRQCLSSHAACRRAGSSARSRRGPQAVALRKVSTRRCGGARERPHTRRDSQRQWRSPRHPHRSPAHARPRAAPRRCRAPRRRTPGQRPGQSRCLPSRALGEACVPQCLLLSDTARVPPLATATFSPPQAPLAAS
mmetsp:Transcript_13434/g.30865  ORF Transcript_13434/g.30865 Transcript_13434/m.30865 type:complete len:223 (+) Transcript_13434:254-922(+)